MRAHNNRGFTLIELLIAVAIVGILAAIAFPSYQNHVEKTRRTTAQSDLMQLAQWMERQYSSDFDYRDSGGGNPALRFDHSPRESDAADAFYDISFQNVTQDTYVLQAQPKNGQSGDECGTLTLDENGNRGSDGTDCW